MLSNSSLLLFRLRLALLSLVHSAADAEERLSRGARRLRWALRDRIDAASAIVPAASLLLRGSVRVLSIYLEALAMLLSLVPSPARLQRRWRAAAAALKTLLTTKTAPSVSASAVPTTNRKQPQRGRPPPRPATEAAVILAETDEAEIPLECVADVLEWCVVVE